MKIAHYHLTVSSVYGETISLKFVSMAKGGMQGCLVLDQCLSVTDTRSCILPRHRSPVLFVLMMKQVTSGHFIVLHLSRLTVTVCGLVEQGNRPGRRQGNVWLTTEQQKEGRERGCVKRDLKKKKKNFWFYGFCKKSF